MGSKTITKNLCANKLQDASFHLEKLVRKEEMLIATVASEEITNLGTYDFTNLMEALLWVKQVGSAVNQPQGIQLDLAPGTHFWEDNDILAAGETHALSYMRGNKLILDGLDKANTMIVFKNTLSSVIFQDCDIELKSLTFEISGYHSVQHVAITGKRSSIKVETCNFQDVSLAAQDKTIMLVNDNVDFNVNHTHHRVAIEASTASFVKCEKTDFGGVDFVVSAVDKSEVYLHMCLNISSLQTSMPLNTRSTDLSIIYDHVATGLHKTNLLFMASGTEGVVTNDSGTNAIIPSATPTLAGLLSSLDKKKLDSLSAGFNGNLYQLLFKTVDDTNRLSITPSEGEPLWVKDTQKLYIGDGSTAGGLDLLDIHSQHYIPVIEKGVANGVATLGSNGKIPQNQMPLLAINNTFITTSEASMTQLTAETGDLTIRTDIGETFVLDGDPADVNNWYRMQFSAGVAAFDDLNDVILSAPLLANQVIMYDGRYWRNQDISHKTGSAWDSAHNYIPGDIITYNHTIYVATSPSVNDVPPSANWETQVLIEVAGRLFDSLVSYPVGDMVSHLGKAYIAKINYLPGAGWISANWEPIGGDVALALLNGYVKPSSGGAIVPTDTIGQAIGKLEVYLTNATAGGGDANVQSDWSELSTGSDSFIQNKPTTISPAQATKLAGVQDGAQKNIQANWTAVTPATGQIANQPVGVIVEAGRNAIGGFAGINAQTKIEMSVIPALPTGDVHAAADNAAMFALTGVVAGDIVIVEDTGELYFANPGISATGGNTIANYTQMVHPANGVISVNGNIGIVNVDGSNLPVTGYAIATSDLAIDPTDKITEALGKLEFKIKAQSTLEGLDDTTFTNLVDGQLAMYDGTKWVNTHTLDGGTY